MILSNFKGGYKAYVYILIVISVIGFVIYRMIKKKSTSSNIYTQYDDVIMGKKIEVKRESPLEDSKHVTQYEEKVEKDKTVSYYK
nr:FeoB-associated Cys-rich membrane protein [Fredinandcohnia onubensis]